MYFPGEAARLCAGKTSFVQQEIACFGGMTAKKTVKNMPFLSSGKDICIQRLAGKNRKKEMSAGLAVSSGFITPAKNILFSMR